MSHLAADLLPFGIPGLVHVAELQSQAGLHNICLSLNHHPSPGVKAPPYLLELSDLKELGFYLWLRGIQRLGRPMVNSG